MKGNILVRVVQAVVAVACALSGAFVSAQNYPSRLNTLMVPYPPGGSVDLIARLAAPTLGERLGQKVALKAGTVDELLQAARANPGFWA